MQAQAASLLLSNNRPVCPHCGQPLNIYGSALATEQSRLYAAECQNTQCNLLLRFQVRVESIIRPSRLLATKPTRDCE